MSGMTFVGILLLIIALCAIILGMLGWTRKLPGNSYIGIKVPEVRKSRQMWDAAHQTAGPLWVISGVAFSFAGLLCFVNNAWLWLLAAVLTFFGVVLVALGSSLGSRTVAVLADHDAKQEAAQSSCCSAGGEEEVPSAPEVDVEALRRAVKDH